MASDFLKILKYKYKCSNNGKRVVIKNNNEMKNRLNKINIFALISN